MTWAISTAEERLRWASAVMGTMLKVKPILRQDGQVLLQKVRGKGAAHKRIVDLVEDLWAHGQLVGITHADDAEAAEKLRDMLSTTLGYKNFLVNIVGSVLGCHIGLGGVAAFFVNTCRDTEHPQPLS